MYNKLFSKILDSSIWLEPAETRIVWITLLAAMDEDGYAHFAAMENLANRARVTVEQAATAIATFEAPDKNSSNPANSGRRVQRVPGGYMILNASAHRAVMNRIQERETVRNRVAKHRLFKSKRAKDKAVASVERYIPLHTVTAPLPTVTPASVYASEPESEAGGVLRGGPLDLSNYIREKVCELYSRPNKTLSYIEQQAVAEIVKRPGVGDELILLMAFRQKGEFFPESVTSLLDNWGTTVDRARTHENHPRTDRKRFDRNKGTLNEGKTAQYNLSAINARKLRAAVPNPERPAA